MTLQEIKNYINNNIITNGVRSITAAIMNTALNNIADFFDQFDYQSASDVDKFIYDSGSSKWISQGGNILKQADAEITVPSDGLLTITKDYDYFKLDIATNTGIVKALNVIEDLTRWPTTQGFRRNDNSPARLEGVITGGTKRTIFCPAGTTIVNNYQPPDSYPNLDEHRGIITGTGEDLTFGNDTVIDLVYDFKKRSWLVIGERVAVATPSYEIPFEANITTFETDTIRFTVAGGTGTIAWGDGTTDTISGATSHSYSANGTYSGKIIVSSLASITDITEDGTNNRLSKIFDGMADPIPQAISLNIDGGQLTALDLSKVPIKTTFKLRNNSNLKSITFSATGNEVVTEFRVNSCDLTGALDMSNVPISGIFAGESNSNLTSINFASSGNGLLTSFSASACDLTGILDLSNVPISGTFGANSNSNLTEILFKTSGNAVVTSFNCETTGLTTLDLSNVPISGSFNVRNCSNLTSINFASSGNGLLTSFQAFNCDLTGTLDLSNVPISGIFSAYSNSNLTGITFKTSGNSTVTSFNTYSCDLTGTLDLSNVPISGIFSAYSNSNLTGITFKTSGNGLTTTWRVDTSDLAYVDFTNWAGMFAGNNCNFQIQSNSMTAAEVNQILVDLYSLVSGEAGGGDYTGRSINIAGSNAAPDGSSGGYDGLTAKTNLQGKEFTVTTN